MIEGALKDGQLVTSDWRIVRERLDGVHVREVLHVPRDHGIITEMYRPEWDPTGLPIVHAYQSRLFPGAIGAWSCHARNVDRLFVNQGHLKLVLYDGREDSPTFGRLDELHIGDARPAFVVLPTGIWHGLQNLGATDALMINFPSFAYDYADPDHYRLPWDSDHIPYAWGAAADAASLGRARTLNRPAFPGGIESRTMASMADWITGDIPNQSGRLAIVTGATGGIGLETAIGLAGAGAEVVLAGRNPARGRAAEALIRDRHRDAQVRFETADLASLASVAGFADRMLATGRPIDILVNNAGVMALPRRATTTDGFEMQLGTNYLSHFALTARLLPLLTAAKARVVQVSSLAHRTGAIRLDDLDHEQGYKPWPVYAQSKLAMLMLAIELDRRSGANGWALTSVAAHPGYARTDLVANGPASAGGAWLRRVSGIASAVMGHSAAAGAMPTLMAATMRGVAGGQYFGPRRWFGLKGAPGPAAIAPQALDPAVAAKLWAASERLAGVAFV